MEAGAYFTVRELCAVFPRFKSFEAQLDKEERDMLIKIEKILYNCLSVEEIERMQDKATDLAADFARAR